MFNSRFLSLGAVIVSGEASDIQESVPRKWGNDNYCSKNTSNPLSVLGALVFALSGKTRGEGQHFLDGVGYSLCKFSQSDPIKFYL